MHQTLALQLISSVMLGLLVGLDPRLAGRRYALLGHSLMAAGGALAIASARRIGGDGAGDIVAGMVALAAALTLLGYWLRRERLRRGGAARTADRAGLPSLVLAAAFGVACGLGSWLLIGCIWIKMLGLYWRRLSQGTEHAETGLSPPAADYVRA